MLKINSLPIFLRKLPFYCFNRSAFHISSTKILSHEPKTRFAQNISLGLLCTQKFSSIPQEDRYKPNNEDVSISNIKPEKKIRSTSSYLTPAALYMRVMVRVIQTCEIYLDLSNEEKDKIETDSRFYYVKTRLDQLIPEEQEQFLQYLKLHTQLIPEKKPENKRKKHIYHLSKKAVMKFLGNEKYGKLLLNLIFDFLRPSNPDYMLYLDGQDQRLNNQKAEFRYFRFLREHQAKIFSRFQMIEETLEKNKNKINTEKSISNVDTEQEKQNKKRAYHTSTVYPVAMIRVVQTCLIYLNSPIQEREKADNPKSRFYYIKNKIDSLNTEEQQQFLAYLNTKIQFARRNPRKNMPHQQPSTRFYKGRVARFLEVEKYGPFLKGLILDFLQPDNPDLLLHFRGTEDEKKIGEIVKFKKPRGVKRSKSISYIMENLVVIRSRFENMKEIIHFSSWIRYDMSLIFIV